MIDERQFDAMCQFFLRKLLPQPKPDFSIALKMERLGVQKSEGGNQLGGAFEKDGEVL